MNRQFHSLKSCFSKKNMEYNSVMFLDSYSPWLSNEDLDKLFCDTFNEEPSLFEINGKCKEVAEELMINYYHNEAFIKARFAKELKKHKAVSFFELPVCDSRADLCSINGNSVAYEIKTIYDTTKRLLKQVTDYLKAFEYVYVICPKEKTETILDIVPREVGIYEYDNSKKKPCFVIVKEASLSPFVDRGVQLDILRKSEKPKNVDSLTDSEINCLFKKALKTRYRVKWKKLIENMNDIYLMDYQYCFNNF